jgi:hypothetical protein
MNNNFLTLYIWMRGRLHTWNFCINTVDGKDYFFCRNRNGRIHSFKNAAEQTAKIARFIGMGYKPCRFERLPV